ncbi:hypothetical protein ABVF61_25100 [Roseibium sp. HPY-6]|uniref:hypothetical protein n=1 Tax=Roseibium sp. HPY-6 TaxID=3229852 RepID=UPI00338E36CE
MPFQFNIGDHVSSQIGFTCFSLAQYRQLKWSRAKLFELVKTNPNCDAYFCSLPGGRSLTNLINDRSIWVNFAPSIEAPRYGKACLASGEIGIADRAFRMGKWTVLATLIHELACLNGASDRGGDSSAEEAVYFCGLGTSEKHDCAVEDLSWSFLGNHVTEFVAVP